MRSLEAVCSQIDLPQFKNTTINSISRLADAVLAQTQGNSELSFRLRSKKEGLPTPAGEKISGELIDLWLYDRENLPFDCKLPIFVLAQTLQKKDILVEVGYYKHGNNSVHPHLLVDRSMLVEFGVDNIDFEPQAVVQPFSTEELENFIDNHYIFTDLNQAIYFGDLRQQYNIVNCDQVIEKDIKELRLKSLVEQMQLVTSG